MTHRQLQTGSANEGSALPIVFYFCSTAQHSTEVGANAREFGGRRASEVATDLIPRALSLLTTALPSFVECTLQYLHPLLTNDFWTRETGQLRPCQQWKQQPHFAE